MHTWLSESDGNTLGLKVAGKITSEDYEAFLPRFVEQVSSIEPAALWQELKFDSKHLKDVERCALVGDSAWEKWMAKMSTPFMKGEVKFFEPEAMDEAWAWLRR